MKQVKNEDKLTFMDLSDEDKLAIMEAIEKDFAEVWVGKEWHNKFPNRMVSLDYIYRTKPRKTIINWEYIHPNLKAYARDKDGEGWFYKVQPTKKKLTWWADDGADAESCWFSEKVIQVGDEPWDESLILRPEGE